MSYYLFGNTVIPYYCNSILIIIIMFFKSIAAVMETSDVAADEDNQSEKELEIVTDEDANRNVTAAEALKKLDEEESFI